MINKKGFTLIELLGVVIILGLLVTLVLPSIINSIKKSSDETDAITKDLVLNAADLYIRDNKNYYEVSNGSEFCIPLIDLTNSSYLKTPLSYKNNDDITNNYSVKVYFNEKYSYELIESKNCPEPIFVAKATTTTGIVPQLDSDGNFVPGSEFSIKVSDEIGYLTFFVLSNDNNYVNLIAQKNLASNGTLTTSIDIIGDEWYSDSNNRYGPQTAYKYLTNATSKWENIPVIESFNYLDEGNQSNSNFGYKSINTEYDSESGNYLTIITPLSAEYGEIDVYENMRARLPKYSEIIENTSCTTTDGSCDDESLWVVDYLKTNTNVTGGTSLESYSSGYWLLSSCQGSGNEVSGVHYYGRFYNYPANNVFGIRPVITLKKSELIRAMEQM